MRRKYKYKPKAKTKTSGATVKRMLRDRLGDRPSLDRGLTDVLNWYNQMFEDHQQAYDAVLQYLIESGADKSVAKWTGNRAIIMKHVTSGLWGLADLLNSGEQLDTDVINRFRLRIRKILTVAVPETAIEYVQKTPSEKARDRHIALVADIEEMIDGANNIIRRMKRPPFDYAEFVQSHNVTADEQEAIAAYYKPQYQEIVDAYKGRIEEGYGHLKPVQLKAMAEVLSSIILAKVSVPVTLRKQRVARVSKVKVTKSKSGKKTRGVKAPPPTFHNQAATIIYYPGQKQVAVLFAEDNKKLILSRKTIQNIDPKRSYAKRFGKQRDTLTNLKKSKFDKVLKFVDSVAATKLPAPARFREGAVIINNKE